MGELIKIDAEQCVKLGKKAKAQALSKGFTETQATIVEQLKALNPLFIAEYGIDAIINVKRSDFMYEGTPYPRLNEATSEGIRLHIRDREAKATNIDIWLDEGADEYRIIAVKVEDFAKVVTVADINGVYFVELHDRIRFILVGESA